MKIMARYNELPRIRKESGVFWIEVDKIKPNPMQPRRNFDQARLKELADSIRQYGVLQPLVVIRQEKEVPNGTIVEYELIAGERRWRAAQIAGLTQVPVIIREEPAEKVKLELALIENLQREDLNPLERAEAFKQLSEEFKMRHMEIGAKIGKSREFVTNTIRLLNLPEEIKEGLRQGLITEGHTRPLLSLANNPDEQIALYKEIVYRKMSVREAERVSRTIIRRRNQAVRRMNEIQDIEMMLLQQQLSRILGARVSVEQRGEAKRVSIDFFSEEELRDFLNKIKGRFDFGDNFNSGANLDSEKSPVSASASASVSSSDSGNFFEENSQMNNQRASRSEDFFEASSLTNRVKDEEDLREEKVLNNNDGINGGLTEELKSESQKDDYNNKYGQNNLVEEEGGFAKAENLREDDIENKSEPRSKKRWFFFRF